MVPPSQTWVGDLKLPPGTVRVCLCFDAIATLSFDGVGQPRPMAWGRLSPLRPSPTLRHTAAMRQTLSTMTYAPAVDFWGPTTVTITLEDYLLPGMQGSASRSATYIVNLNVQGVGVVVCVFVCCVSVSVCCVSVSVYCVSVSMLVCVRVCLCVWHILVVRASFVLVVPREYTQRHFYLPKVKPYLIAITIHLVNF